MTTRCLQLKKVITLDSSICEPVTIEPPEPLVEVLKISAKFNILYKYDEHFQIWKIHEDVNYPFYTKTLIENNCYNLYCILNCDERISVQDEFNLEDGDLIIEDSSYNIYQYDEMNENFKLICSLDSFDGVKPRQIADQGCNTFVQTDLDNLNDNIIRSQAQNGFVWRKSDANTSGDDVFNKNGVRMMFLPQKDGALRAGESINNVWNLSNIGVSSVAFGFANKASGENSTAFGQRNEASELNSTAFGQSNEASGENSTAFGQGNTASELNSTAFGEDNKALKRNSTAFGEGNSSSNVNSTAFGRANEASGENSTAFGRANKASGENSTAFGLSNEASGIRSTAFGAKNIASEQYSTAFGVENKASEFNSTAFGQLNIAMGENSTAFGEGNIADKKNLTCIGRFNNNNGGNIDDLFIIGNGTSAASRSNVFRVSGGGGVYGGNAYIVGGADYAEFFESVSGEKIPVGTVVCLVDGKIDYCNDPSTAIGVISNRPSVLGNAEEGTADEWIGKYLKDKWGNYIFEEVTYVDRVSKFNEETGEESFEEIEKTELRRKLNPEFDPSVEYIPREMRDEWNVVGLVGQVRVLKNQVKNERWIKMKDVNDEIELYLIR